MKCERLDVWKKATRLSIEVYKSFAQCRDFGFKDQITRSSLSIPSNIAEGLEKSSIKEQIRFLDIAKGSTAEFVTQTFIAMDIGYLNKELGREWISTADQLLAMLTKLQQSKQARNPKPRTQNSKARSNYD
jgi:four helix bundle protein